MTRLLVLFILCLGLSTQGHAQVDPIFPDLDGTLLRDALFSTYRVENSISYSEARAEMYSDIDLLPGDSIRCVYTGYTVPMDINAERATTYLLNLGINTEHVYPRSKGALRNTVPYSDMHHLFPSEARANQIRASFPFAEVNDRDTDKWLINQDEFSSIPTTNIDAYSEFDNNVAFEPKESFKGNVARAYFYFYTMYKEIADREDPDFFENQRADLCDWHFQDPTDSLEMVRSSKIAALQGNENPFVLDCSLARLYCDEIDDMCKQTVSIAQEENTTYRINSTPLGLLVYNGGSTPHQLTVHDIAGRKVLSTSVNPGVSIVELDNMYTLLIVRLISPTGVVHTEKVLK